MSRLSLDDWVCGRPDLQRELSLLRENLASERQAKIERGEMLVKAEAVLATLRHDLSVAQNWVEHHSKHADDLIAENVALRAAGNEMARIIDIPKDAPIERWASEEEIDAALKAWRALEGGGS